MPDKHSKHEKVRFRRGDIRRLHELPSASAQTPFEILKMPRFRTGSRRMFKAIGAAAFLLVFLVAAIIAIGASGMGTARFEIAARSAMSSIAGQDVAASFGDARLTWRGPGLIGLELRDTQLSTKAEGGIAAKIDRVQFGIKPAPLLSGNVELSGVRLTGLQLRFEQVNDASRMAGGILDERGLVDPDRLAARIFSVVSVILDAAGRTGEKIRVSSSTIEFPAALSLPPVTVKELEVVRNSEGLSFTSEMEMSGMSIVTEGQAAKGGENPGSVSFELVSRMPAFHWTYTPGSLERPFARTITAGITMRLTGAKSEVDETGTIRSSVDIPELVLETVHDERQQSSFSIAATLAEGSGKIEFDRIHAMIGRTELDFNGAIQPAPADVSEEPVYRYELVSDGSRIGAADVPERTVGILARIAGIADPSGGRVTADEIRVRTNGGEVLGNAAIVFPGGKTPAVFLAITVPKMPVPHAKQLWPWKAADAARSWVLDNVYGGEVRDSSLEMSVPAGRIGSGIPFRGDEVFGHFEVYGTRFDTAGQIPPVRDADGTIDFQGTEVQIKLSSGTAFLPSGRMVDAANGTFDINAGEHPLIGALEIDVSGDADAVAELSTFEPIRANRFAELAPADFSGSVTGHVSANIPLEQVPDMAALDWKVALDYKDLSVSKPIGGQALSEATGSIVVEPRSATIEAIGRLNGLPAEIALIEPLDGTSAGRKRDIKLELDNKAREIIAPALNTILSGPVRVNVGDDVSGSRNIVADLTRAVLKFPWAGWSKGAGVPAEATFTLEEGDTTTLLKDIKLSGKTFSFSGSATVRDGSIEKAQFNDVTLNRNDSFDLSVERSGKKGYRLSVTGKRIDARSLIRQFLSDPEEADKGLDNTPITLTANAETVLGFGNELISDVAINYNGTGSHASGVRILATTDSGEKFAVTQGTDADGRTVEVQSADAGSILRFLNIYDNMQGGSINIRLSAKGDAPLRGKIDARDFWIVNEPRLEALVSTAPESSGRSLNQAVKREIDVSRAKFDQGFAQIEKGNGYLAIADGVLRGPLIGSTFQGELYDAEGRISMTGTFMPAYGLNRLFADIPLVGLFLGNGRDRGLIGITYKLSGDAKSPNLQVNPISIIAPGVFRQIFEFR